VFVPVAQCSSKWVCHTSTIVREVVKKPCSACNRKIRNLTLEKWDYETDILIVGSGAAAYAAAISARNRGAEVIMVEKASLYGGTTLRSGGGLWVPNNRFQREKGIEDRKEDAIRYMARDSFPQLYNRQDPHLGLPENEYNLIATYYDTASNMLDFMWILAPSNLYKK
jgi:hypothetical protein